MNKTGTNGWDSLAYVDSVVNSGTAEAEFKIHNIHNGDKSGLIFGVFNRDTTVYN